MISTADHYPSMVEEFDTYFLESDDITGPWSYVTYMEKFGPEAYFVHFPSKFAATSVQRASASVAAPAAEGGAFGGDIDSGGGGSSSTTTTTTRSSSSSNNSSSSSNRNATATAATTGGFYNAFLSYSANFAFHGTPEPLGSGYHLSLQQSRFALSSSFMARLNESDGVSDSV